MSEPKRTRLIAMRFADELISKTVLESIKGASARKEIEVEDWALITKAADGKVTLATGHPSGMKPGKGAAAGGAAGLVLAVLSGPIGAGAVLGGAAIGAVSAALRESGFKNSDLDAISGLMASGASGLLITVPLDQADRFETFMAGDVVFEAVERKHEVDIVPGHSFEQALEEYRQQQA